MATGARGFESIAAVETALAEAWTIYDEQATGPDQFDEAFDVVYNHVLGTEIDRLFGPEET